MGGVLQVAGIDGFLGNLDQVRKASDSEGAAWRSFVTAWWDRFGTAEVTTADLFDVAILSELDLGSGSDPSRRIRLGKLLGRMRDRMFKVADRDVRVAAVRVLRGVQRWALRTEIQNGGVSGQEVGGVGGVEEQLHPQLHPENTEQNQGAGWSGGSGGSFPAPYARAHTHAHAKDSREKLHPLHPLHPEPCNRERNSGGHGGGSGDDTPPSPRGTPNWLLEDDS